MVKTIVGGEISPHFSHLGSGALLCSAPEPLDISWQRRIWALAQRAESWPGISEVMPGMNNLMLVFDPLIITAESLQEDVLEAWPDCVWADDAGTTFEVDVVYGGEYGMDLAHVAQHAGLTIEQTVNLHAAPTYTVYSLGAYPGFAYLGGLHTGLFTPRRTEPRLLVPAGSVAIGGAQAGVIPSALPSGWQIIGRTKQSFFDINNSPPALLSPGDRIKFRVEAIVQ